VAEVSVAILLPDYGGIGYHAQGTVAGARERGVVVSGVEVASSTSFLNLVRTAWRVRELLKIRNVLFVEIGRNEGTTFLTALLASWMSGKKMNVLSHDGAMLVRSPGAFVLARRRRLSKRVAYRLADPLLSRWLRILFQRRVERWYATTEGARDEMLAAHLAPCFVIVHGLEDPVSTSSPSEGRAIVVPGFLGPNKGTDVAVDAWLQTTLGDGYFLHVIGNTHEGTREWANRLHEQLINAGRPFQWTVDTASDDEFQHAIANAAMVLVPYRESNPTSGVVIRAIVEGRCIIGSAVPAILSFVTDGVSGVVIPSADVTRLANAMVTLAADSQLRDQYGARLVELQGHNRRWVDQFVSIAQHW